MTFQTLVFRYTLFAVIASLANLATQRLVLLTGETPLLFALAVAIGTLVGLGVKYLLDKRWIFYDPGTGLAHHRRKFSLYTAMGVVTTAIFWGFETVFWVIWQTDAMRELGAVIGLTIGYVLKYKLDRHYVFTDTALHAEAAA